MTLRTDPSHPSHVRSNHSTVGLYRGCHLAIILKKLLIHFDRFSPLEYHRVAFVHGHGGVLLKHSRSFPSSPCEEVQEMLLAEGAGPRRRVDPIGAALDETRLLAHGKPSLLMTRKIQPNYARVDCRNATTSLRTIIKEARRRSLDVGFPVAVSDRLCWVFVGSDYRLWQFMRL